MNSNQTTDRDEHNRQVKQKILDAARELLLAGGVEGFSMRKLAAKIGYTATGIYHHFPNKQAVLQALINTDFKAFRASLGKIGQVDDPIDRIRKMAIAYVEFAMEFPDHYRLLFMTPPAVAEHEIKVGDPAEDAYAFLRLTVEEGLAAGRFRAEFTDADELSQIIWSCVHGLVALHIAKRTDPWVPWRPLAATTDRMCDALLRGLKAED